MVRVIKTQNDWRDVERPQVALHRNCHLFSFVFYIGRFPTSSWLTDKCKSVKRSVLVYLHYHLNSNNTRVLRMCLAIHGASRHLANGREIVADLGGYPLCIGHERRPG